MEHRFFPRIDIDERLECTFYRKDSEFAGTILNVSEDGMLFSASEDVDIARDERLIFQFLDGDDVVCGVIKVKHVERTADGIQAGGLYFRSLNKTKDFERYVLDIRSEIFLDNIR